MKRIISEEVIFRLRDPRIGFVTITRVAVTSDLSDAKVYFSVLGNEEDIRTTTRGLKSATASIRAVVAKEMELRSVPRLEFVFDPSLREQAEIDRVLREDRLKHEAEGGKAEARGTKVGGKNSKAKTDADEETDEADDATERDKSSEE